jgi:hypothetical protein
MEPGVVDEQSSVRRDGHDVDVSMLPGNVVVGVALPRPQRVSARLERTWPNIVSVNGSKSLLEK